MNIILAGCLAAIKIDKDIGENPCARVSFFITFQPLGLQIY